MDTNPPAYGLWTLVAINVAVFVFFALSFYKPQTSRDWRSFGAFTAFLIALFTEMYGFPLTIYLLSGWLLSKYPNLDLLSHNAGHLWQTLLGWKGDSHFDVLHFFSYLLIGGGFALIGSAWNVLYQAQHEHQIARTGLYAKLRHPQYAGFVLILVGFLVQWPTIITFLMFPIMMFMYWRLAKREEQEALTEFGDEYAAYMASTPAFIPHRRTNQPQTGGI